MVTTFRVDVNPFTHIAEFEARMNLMDAKQEKYMDLYRAERGKSAKLIEA